VTLKGGHRFDGRPGSGDYLIGDFEEYQIRIPGSGPVKQTYTKRTAMPSMDLLRSPNLADRVELEHRLSAPLSILTLTLLAIPLVDPSPRQRASGRILLAFLAYFSFFNLQRLAESWLENGVTPPWLSSLWYQFAVLLFVHAVLLPESFWVKRLGYRLAGGMGLEAKRAH
jgi:lipopolysaccharide export system permease protein